MCGIPLPAGLRESDRLPEPLFTPSTKAESGHDENIYFDAMVASSAAPVAERARDIALALYRLRCRARASRRGSSWPTPSSSWAMPGRATTPSVILIDEVMTPDSSRFWDAATYEPGRAQASYDKQFVRDWLEAPGLGQDAARAGAARRASSRARAPRTSRPSSASPAPASTLPGRGLVDEHHGSHRPMSTFRFTVSVMPRDGILDPQGAPSRRACRISA